MKTGTRTGLITLGILVVVILASVGWVISGYNRVVTMDENVKTRWAQVDNQLKRRYDLIPNLVETVKGYAAHEKGIFENIAEARTKYFQAKGTKEQPMCGFSHRAIHVMSLLGEPFEVVNIFDDPDIRPALVEFSGWPTTPQLFIDGELIGGSDIVVEMYESGELQSKLGGKPDAADG